jgi:N-acetylglucosaminyl-diphospho-decaprenol L-rhamnosyltransferase
MTARDGDVDIVVSIVTWRAAALTIECLATLDPEIRMHPSARAIVVDNDSRDGTYEAVREAISSRGWSQWATVVRAPFNGGFAYGNNVAIRIAAGSFPGIRYFLMLNPDAFIEPGSIACARSFMDANPEVGIVGGQCTDKHGMKAPSAFRFPTIIGEFVTQVGLGVAEKVFHKSLMRLPYTDSPIPADWVVGALMMVRWKVFQSTGGFDEGYFLYFEETDFSLRAGKDGWTTWHVPGIRALHLEGQLTGVQEGPNKIRMPGYWFDSRRRYFVLNHGFWYALAADAAAILGAVLFKVACVMRMRETFSPPRFIRDLVVNGAFTKGSSDIPPRKAAW